MNITGLNFAPDFAWIKSRSAATDHAVYDSVRGVQKRLETNTTDAEATSDGGVTAFNSNGVTLGTLAQVNTNAATYALWAMKKGVTPGFDVVTGTSGASPIAHSLGVKPAMIIAKGTSTGGYNWMVTHKELGTNMQDYYIRLNTTDSAVNSAGAWGGEPTSTQFYAATTVMGATYNLVAYLFAGVEGFSKFGKYTGNGGADGPFVWCGFRPKFVLIKIASGSSYWSIKDNQRSPYNPSEIDLRPNASDSDRTGIRPVDFLSNGFKIRNTDTDHNTSSATYIFAAFAEAPFKYARGR